MRVVAIHSHLGGLEFLTVHRPEIMSGIEGALASRLGSDVASLATAIRQTMKAKRIAVGTRGGAQRAEWAARYRRDLIDVGIEILPMKSLQERMSSGPGYYEGELYNLIREGRGVPAVPLVLIGVEP